jgi:predicted Zn-dependent protease with MMP-like domain
LADAAVGQHRPDGDVVAIDPVDAPSTTWWMDGYASTVDPWPLDDAIEAIVVEAIERLPDEFRTRLGSVAIVIEDEPSAAQLASVGARGLYGLYQGVPRTAYGAEHAALPSKITLFRGPLSRAARGPEALAELVTDTVYHEIAHHFGISDARLHEVRRGAR